MYFYRKPKENDNPDGKRFAVYMKLDSEHYVCDMVDGDTADDIAANELGLTLRARLTRSKGKYAMLEGAIFNPERLLGSVCEISNFKTEEFVGGEYKRGYTLLTVTADGCTNKVHDLQRALIGFAAGKNRNAYKNEMRVHYGR